MFSLRPNRGYVLLIYFALALPATMAGCRGTESGLWSKKTVQLPQNSAPSDGTDALNLDDEQMFDVQLAMARTFEQQSDLERAESAYTNLLRTRPHHVAILHRLAVVCDHQNRFAESERHFRHALAGKQDDPALLTDFGYSLYRQSRWSDAEQVLRQAVASHPGDRRAHNHLGLVLCQMGRRDDALAQFQLAGCTPAESHMNVALVLTMNDDFEGARREYALALSRGPVSRELNDQARELDRLLADAGVDASPVVEVGSWGPVPAESPPHAAGYIRLTGE